MKRIYLLATIALTGCATDDDPPANEPLPGKGDSVGYYGVNQRGEQQPCGYHVAGESLSPNAPPYSYEYDGAYTYDGAGNVTAEHSTGEPASDTTYQYDALGNVTRMTFSFAGGEPLINTIAYDSFGRFLRFARDYGDDGVDDSATTYSYLDGAPRASTISQRILTDKLPNSTSYDRTYHYDELARRVGYEQDNGPDGTIDQTSVVVYDDAARNVVETTRNAAGVITSTVDSTYSPSNKLVRDLRSYFEADKTYVTETTWTYDGARLLAYTVIDHDDTLTSPPTSTYVQTYRYDSCN